MTKIVYVASNKNSYGGSLDTYNNDQWLNNDNLYNGEHYLYKQIWSETTHKMLHETYVKIVSNKWLATHTNFYKRPVLQDFEGSTDNYWIFVNKMQNA